MSRRVPDDVYQRRGRIGILMLLVPTVAILGVGVAYGTLFWAGTSTQLADGPEATIRFRGCAEARPFLERRVAHVGLTDARWADTPDGFAVTAHLPGRPRVAEALPATLATTGRFEVRNEPGRAGGLHLTPDDIDHATVEMGFLDLPRAVVQLEPEAAAALKVAMESEPEGAIALLLDGEIITRRRNMPSETQGRLALDLGPSETITDLERVDFAAHAATVIEHGPLPCPVDVIEVTTVSTPPG